MATNKLVDVFATPEKFIISWDEVDRLLFERNRFKGSPSPYEGEMAIVGRLDFMREFEKFTCGLLRKIDWDNVLVAGGSVVGCLRGLDPEIEPPSDVDIFLYGLTDEETAIRIRVLLAQLNAAINKALKEEIQTRREERLQNGQEDYKESLLVEVVKTPNALTIIPSLVTYVGDPRAVTGMVRPFPSVQIIMRKYASKRSIFNSFDVDCCCVGWDGGRVWAHPRAQRALVTGVNTVNLAYKNPRSYEHRLLKYARRGFAIHDPALGSKPTLLSSYLQTPDPQNPETRVPVEWLVRCIRRTSGLLQIMLADEAEKRGVRWATGFDSLISFDGEIDDELDTLEDDHDRGPVIDDDGSLLVFGPLREPHRHEVKHACKLKDLLESIAVPQAQESVFLRFVPGIVPARDAHNRKAWETGLYDEEELELDDALPSRQGPSSLTAHKPSSSSLSGALSSTASSGSPTVKRRNTGGGGARVAALLPPSLLMDLPRVLLLEILQRCTGPALASLAATCKPLRAVVTRGTWRRITARDFGDTRERPTGCRQPEPWNSLYGALQGLGALAWRQWDEHPLRLECIPLRRQGDHPFPRGGHATAFMGGDKLVMTGGLCTERALEAGSFVFDLATSKWTKQPTFVRNSSFPGDPIPTRPPPPFELPGRTHHTATAVSDHELILLFGKQRATEDEDEPSLVSEVLSLDVRDWTYTRVRQEGDPPRPRRSHSACAHPDGNALLVFGGSVATYVDLSSEPERADDTDDAVRVFTPGELEVLDDLHVLRRVGLNAWEWSKPATSGRPPLARCGHSAVVVGRTMVVVGGTSNVISLPNEVYLLDVDTFRWRTLFMPTCFPPKNVTFPNAAVAIGRKLLLTRGGAETYVIDLDGRTCERLHDSMFDKKLGGRVPEVRTGHSLTRVGVSVYMVGGRMELADDDRKPMENLQILDLIGKRVV